MSPDPVVFTVAAPDPAGGRPADAWADLDLAAITAKLKATGVVAPADQTPELTKLVKEAKADGHDLFVFVTDKNYAPFTVYRDIAHELQTSTGGTVLVFGAGGLGTSSTDFSRVQIEDATAEKTTGASVPQAAREIYEKATDPNVDWTLVTIALIVVVIIGAVAARLTGRRRTPAAARSESRQMSTDAESADAESTGDAAAAENADHTS
ncbi:Rv1476 family membrane protein [Gordonia sp. (in: high G+C Gram-positive bacteria)]|uniref:Rv1476 family membrane protein n=1 Tax=Gordonia sp. (in: high G+C Gram-positive bacteria) TaxID=84139 RepID=UPI003F9DE457